MADLNVQPKKKSILPWVVLFVGVLVILFFLFRSCSDKTYQNSAATTANIGNERNDNNEVTSDTTASGMKAVKQLLLLSGWEGINYYAPTASYNDITDKAIEVRNDDKYAIYSPGENILLM